MQPFATHLVLSYFPSSQDMNRMSKCHAYSRTAPLRRRQATIAIALLAIFHGAAQTVLATCGDYVMLGGSHASQSAASSPSGPVHHSHSNVPGSNHSGSNVPVRFPSCHGANCHRQAPLAPLSDPTGESNAGQQQWAIWCAQVNTLGLTPRVWVAETQLHLSEGHFARLERPPRSAG
jgi:hypothetical protein